MEHFEEAGFEFEIDFYAAAIFTLGANANNFWSIQYEFNANIIDLQPFRFIVWWNRALAEYILNGFDEFEFRLYIGGSYAVNFLEMWFSYVETGAIAGSDVFALILGT